MICKGCGEAYDEELFPVCPFCLTENKKTEVDSIENKSNLIEASEKYLQEDLVDSSFDTDVCIDEGEDIVLHEDDYAKDINIVDIDVLSMRAKNILRRNGIFKLSELQAFLKNHQLRDINGLGASCECEIEDALKLVGELSKNIEENSLGVKIEDVYYENKYNLFVSYCRSRSILYMNDLDGFDFNSLLCVQGIGKGKIEDIIYLYEQFDSGNFEDDVELDIQKKMPIKTMFGFINEQLIDLDISLLLGMGIKPKLLNMLYGNGYKKLGDIRNISAKTLQQIVGVRNIDKFEIVEEQLKKSLFEIFGGVLSEQMEDEDFSIDIKRASGYTLQELGDEFGVTRERVRQKIVKFNSRLDPFMKPLVELFMFPKKYITTQELLDIYDNDDFDKVIIYWCKNCDMLEYLGFADVFVYVKADGISVESQIMRLAEDFIGEGINLYDNLEELEDLMQNNGYPYMDGAAFINLVQLNGYKVYGDFIVKGKQSYGYLCARIVAEKFPYGIKLYEGTDLDKLRKYSFEEYGDLGIPESNRAFSARLADYLVLSGRGMVTAESNIHIEMTVLDEIKEYIDINQEGEISYAELFSKFEGKLRMLSNIDNYNFLHGVLKLYYSDEYDFSNRDYLKKKGIGYKSGKLSTKIKAFIENVGRPVHRNEIKKQLPGLTDIVLINAILSDNELFQWDYNYYFTISMMQINQNDKEYLYQQIENLINQNDGYCSDHLLFDEVKRNFSGFLKSNNIETANNLFYLCQKLFSGSFDFRRPHIGRKGILEEISVKNVALHLLEHPVELSFRKYQEIAEKLKWSSVTAGMVFGEIEKDYIRVTDDLYIKNEQFTISQNAVNCVEHELREKMSHDYVSLINFDCWDELPEIGYDWNIYFLRSIIDRYIDGLKIVEIRTRDRRYERGIVVDAQSEITDYVDLVIHFLKSLGYSELSENNMLTLLIMNNLTYKMIPKELYVSDKLKYENEKFIILK